LSPYQAEEAMKASQNGLTAKLCETDESDDFRQHEIVCQARTRYYSLDNFVNDYFG